jgi:hypothetical protein
VRRAGVLIALAIIAATAQPAAAGWSAPARAAGPSDAEFGIAWHLAANERGERMVVYDDSLGVHAVFAKAGRGFAPDAELDVPNTADGEPFAAALDERGGAAVGWAYFEDYGDSSCCERAAVSTRRPGRAFGPRLTLTAAGQEMLGIDIAVNPAGAMAIAGYDFEGVRGVFGRAGALGRPALMSCCGDSLTIDDRGDATLTWASDRGIASVTRTRAGRVERRRYLYRRRGVAEYGTFRGDARGVRAGLWREAADEGPGAPRFRLALGLADGDGRFGRPRHLADPFDNYGSPFTELDVARSGAAVAAWSPDGGRGEGVRVVTRRPGRPFGRAQTLRRLAYDARLHGFTTAINRSGRAVVAWTAVLPEGSIGVFAATAAPGRAFGKPRLVSRTGAGLVDTKVESSIDRAGRVTLAWQQGQEIRAAAFRP